jgi:hypothetical protein
VFRISLYLYDFMYDAHDFVLRTSLSMDFVLGTACLVIDGLVLGMSELKLAELVLVKLVVVELSELVLDLSELDLTELGLAELILGMNTFCVIEYVLDTSEFAVGEVRIVVYNPLIIYCMILIILELLYLLRTTALLLERLRCRNL